MRFLFSFIFFSTTLTLFAQENLVSNGSFEQMEHCPLGPPYLDGLIDISTPTLGSSDIWSEICGTAPIYFNTNVYKAKDGSNFMGFATHESIPTGYREYIQLKLKSPLIKDKVYELGGYFKPFGMSRCSDCLEFHLSEEQVFVYTASTIPLSATFSCVDKGRLFCDTLTWEKVTGYFTAKGGELFLTVGCFKEKGEFTSIDYSNYGSPSSYYYVDSMYISDPKLYSTLPNILSPNNDNINDLFEPINFQTDIFNFKLWVYNRWGNLVYSGKSSWDGNCGIDKCTSGTYFYIIEYFRNIDSTLVNTQKGTVTVIH